MARIELSMGMFTLIDDADVPLVDGRSWYLLSSGYAVASDGSHLNLARHLCGSPPGMDVDHRNGDRLDNRRANLRVCTRSVNKLNVADSWPVVSKYLGVYRRFIWDKWFVMVPASKGRQVYCGDYADELAAAARAYDSAIRFYAGKKAKTNFADPIPLDQRQLLIANRQCEPPLSRFRGVSSSGGSRDKRGKRKFGASIHSKGVTYKLGHFTTDREAAAVYDGACVLLGLRKRMNFPKSNPGPSAIDLARQAIFPAVGKVAA